MLCYYCGTPEGHVGGPEGGGGGGTGRLTHTHTHTHPRGTDCFPHLHCTRPVVCFPWPEMRATRHCKRRLGLKGLQSGP